MVVENFDDCTITLRSNFTVLSACCSLLIGNVFSNGVMRREI